MAWDYGPLTKAKLQFVGENETTVIDTHTVMINPAEISVQASLRYADSQTIGKTEGQQQFVSKESDSMSIKLYYDGFIAALAKKSDAKNLNDPEDVSTHIKQLIKNVEINGDEHKPAKCRFTWGSIDILCQITQMQYTYTMFTGEGKPIRAHVQLSVRALRNTPAPVNSPDRTKWRAADGEASLWRMAENEYGDAGLWRVIADANGLRNPRLAAFGMELSIPAV